MAKGSMTPLGKLEKRYVRVPARRLSPKQTEALIKTRERQAEALHLKKAGATYEEIARALGYASASGARGAVKSAIDRIGIEPAKEVVVMDLMRLDEFQKRLTAAFRQGDLSVVGTLMNVMRERRALLGWTPESWSEEQRKGAGVTNNGVMVIQGGSADFVKGMMEAVGVDPNSPEAQKRLALVRAQEKSEQVGEFALTGPKPNTLLGDQITSNAVNAGEEEIVDAVIVEEEI